MGVFQITVGWRQALFQFPPLSSRAPASQAKYQLTFSLFFTVSLSLFNIVPGVSFHPPALPTGAVVYRPRDSSDFGRFDFLVLGRGSWEVVFRKYSKLIINRPMFRQHGYFNECLRIPTKEYNIISIVYK